MVLRRFLIIFIAILLPATAFAAKKYVVKKGDNLYDISSKFNVTVNEIKSANKLKSNRLDIGEELLIPATEKSKELQADITHSNNNEYIVSKGDTLSEIAEKHGVSTASLKKLNGLNTNKLQIGQKLQIPSPREEAPVTAKSRVPAEQNTDPLPNHAESNTDSADRHDVYTVQKGDTLGHLAVKFNTTSAEIRKSNGLKNDRLSIGQKLTIPSQSEPRESNVQKVAAKSTTDTPALADDGTYTVKKGDTPSTIAEKLGVSTAEFVKLNNVKSTNLQIGQKLLVPGYEKTEQHIDEARNSSAKAEVKKDAAAAPIPATDTPKKKPAEYTVKKGDTPSEIAEKLGVSTKELIALNGIKSTNLRIGQKLAVPGSDSSENTSVSRKTEAGDTTTAVTAAKETVQTVPAEYTVQKGDNLLYISKKFGTTVDAIKKKNNLRSSNIRIGQKLILNSPAGETASAEDDKEDTAVSASYTGKYTVRKGDTLGHLAIKFGVSQTEIKRANGLRNSSLRIGQVLVVPGQYRGDEKTVAAKKAPANLSEIYIKKRYVVKRGDTLGGIAGKYGVTVVEIKKASALKNDIINPGDILLIPVAQETVTTSKYTVARGDTLVKIAGRFKVSVSDLKSTNGMTSDKIWVGMKLNIPGVYSSDAAPVIDTNTAVTTQAVRSEYVVKRGDSLGLIAKRYGVSVRALKKENNIKGSVIRVGQVLYIPGYDKPETKYIAVQENPPQNTNGHTKHKKAEVKNGRFSKESIIQVAKKYLGAPYKFGGYDLATGIDCSGYVKKIFSRFNVELPRTARDIYYKSGYRVAKSQLDTGDLVFFQTYAKYPSHVGIYIGNEEFIHASSASKMVTIDSINKRYYRARYIGAKRVQLSGLFYDEYSKDYRGFEN